jgi:hypothetical protein
MCEKVYDKWASMLAALLVASVIVVPLALAYADPLVLPPPEKLVEVIKYQQAQIEEMSDLLIEAVKKIESLQRSKNCV